MIDEEVTKQNISTFVSSLSLSLSLSLSQNVIKMLDERKQKISPLAPSLSLSPSVRSSSFFDNTQKPEKGNKKKTKKKDTKLANQL
jgi:hypothetical protein